MQVSRERIYTELELMLERNGPSELRFNADTPIDTFATPSVKAVGLLYDIGLLHVVTKFPSPSIFLSVIHREMFPHANSRETLCYPSVALDTVKTNQITQLLGKISRGLDDYIAGRRLRRSLVIFTCIFMASSHHLSSDEISSLLMKHQR
jgi:hypothetical protein